MLGPMESFSTWGVRGHHHEPSQSGWPQALLAILFLAATIGMEWARQMGR